MTAYKAIPPEFLYVAVATLSGSTDRHMEMGHIGRGRADWGGYAAIVDRPKVLTLFPRPADAQAALGRPTTWLRLFNVLSDLSKTNTRGPKRCDHPLVRGSLADRLMLGPMRRRRRMHRALRQLDRLDAGLDIRRPKDRLRRFSVVLATSVLVGGCAAVMVPHQLGLTLTADGLARRTPLGEPPHVATGVGTFTFAQHQPSAPDTPVTYDPCEVIYVEINDGLAPPAGELIVRHALDEVSRATGLQFAVEGTTERLPNESSVAPSLGALGGDWPPVLIAWTTPNQLPDLSGEIAGVGGSQAVKDPLREHWRYVTGTVALDAPTLAELLTQPEGERLAQAIVMHELGHLVGLGHVDDPSELMHEDNLGLVTFGPGDLEGLAQLGRGRCR
jgi:hypothetical protein